MSFYFWSDAITPVQWFCLSLRANRILTKMYSAKVCLSTVSTQFTLLYSWRCFHNRVAASLHFKHGLVFYVMFCFSGCFRYSKDIQSPIKATKILRRSPDIPLRTTFLDLFKLYYTLVSDDRIGPRFRPIRKL